MRNSVGNFGIWVDMAWRFKAKVKLITLKCLISMVLLCCGTAFSATSANIKYPKFQAEEGKVIIRFTDLKEAQEIFAGLLANEQKVVMRQQDIIVQLKTLSLGLYLKRKVANAVIKQLQKAGIDAYLRKTESGPGFWVHAGAMYEDVYYWHRHDELARLGFSDIRTSQKPHRITEYLIVALPLTLSDQLVRSKRLFNGYLKGEFSGWGQENGLNTASYFTATLGHLSALSERTNLSYGLRMDTFEQSGELDVQQTRFDYTPTFVQHIQDTNRWTAGTQLVSWGTGKHDSLSDRLSVKDLTRYRLDENILARRRSSLNLRWELIVANYQADLLWMPLFRPAVLPDEASIWHPLSRSDGRIMDIETPESLKYLVKNGTREQEKKKLQHGGLGIKFSRELTYAYHAFTFQYARRSSPYYRVNQQIIDALSAGSDAPTALVGTSGSTLIPMHPGSWVLSFEEGTRYWMFETAFVSDAPITKVDYSYATAIALEWLIQANFQTSLARTDLTIQFSGRQLGSNEALLDRKTRLRVSGELVSRSMSNRWKYGVNYIVGLDKYEFFLNPYVGFNGNRYISFALKGYVFAGEENSEFGYFRNRSLVTLSWSAFF